ncbi:MAG TPA: CBS domain-containing protein [Burkholderiales bacterium]|jgi:CBS domain-containing protein|nr:CBS domain-containing protein [Burkholderiales bacterium]
MFGQRVRSIMERKKLVTAPPATTVRKAADLMARSKVGAVLVVERKQLIGIFTERDALFRVMAKGRDPETTVLADVMSKAPTTIHPDKSFGYALLVMHKNGFRHLPVVENGKTVGIVSARNALDPDLEEFVSESRRREQILREAT